MWGPKEVMDQHLFWRAKHCIWEKVAQIGEMISIKRVVHAGFISLELSTKDSMEDIECCMLTESGA